VRFYFSLRRQPNPTGGTYGAVYALPEGLRSPAARERFAVVDDIISAGSSTRATVQELSALGARVVVVGALLVLGQRADEHFGALGTPVEAVSRSSLTLWSPGQCPLCSAGEPLRLMADPTAD
jgi:orotate phosphoribosyltransferase